MVTRETFSDIKIISINKSKSQNLDDSFSSHPNNEFKDSKFNLDSALDAIYFFKNKFKELKLNIKIPSENSIFPESSFVKPSLWGHE